MAIIRVQDAASIGSAAVKTVTISPSTAGNLLVAAFCNRDSGSVITSVTDDASNSYVQAPGAYGTSTQLASDIWYAENCLGGATTVTFNISPTPGFNLGFCAVIEYSGVLSSGALDVATVFINGSITPAKTAPITVSDSGCVIVAVVDVNQNVLTGVTNGAWSLLPSVPPFDHLLAEFFPGATGTFSTDCTPNVINGESASSASFLPAPTPTNRNSSMFLVF
jgi:hypothetical protein